ncbi:glycoside hydrolase [Oceanicola sp. D3]|uniref:GH25 family lysozyme n=1 Tax=Oceanicola sp. D3 TaxID=2587163 RepID=UPI00111F8C81|nr:GH25 family lysozyme [Oceanicola sp. D3]QDC11520.1 glycoside hydrolase [Oceanicola sp. D3]
MRWQTGLGLATAAVLLWGCGGGSGRIDAPEGATVPALVQGERATVTYVSASRAPGIPRGFGDLDPHEWSGPSPANFQVHGIDAARYQGEIDWTPARQAGVSFAWLKATEGGDHLDPGWQLNAPSARRSGVPVGGYHFYYFCTDARTQAEWFIQNVPRRKGDLPPMLDMEWNHLSPTCKKRPPADEVRASIREFSRIVTAHYGTAPVVYTTPDFYRRNDLGQLRSTEFFLRAVTAHPSEHYPEERWSFWQYSGTGLVPGVAGKVDLNAFAGSRAEWRSWLARRLQ